MEWNGNKWWPLFEAAILFRNIEIKLERKAREKSRENCGNEREAKPVICLSRDNIASRIPSQQRSIVANSL